MTPANVLVLGRCFRFTLPPGVWGALRSFGLVGVILPTIPTSIAVSVDGGPREMCRVVAP